MKSRYFKRLNQLLLVIFFSSFFRHSAVGVDSLLHSQIICDFCSYIWDSILGSLVSWAQLTVKNPTINLSPCKLCIRRINSATGKQPTSTIKCTLVVVITMNQSAKGIFQESHVNVCPLFPL